MKEDIVIFLSSDFFEFDDDESDVFFILNYKKKGKIYKVFIIVILFSIMFIILYLKLIYLEIF